MPQTQAWTLTAQHIGRAIRAQRSLQQLTQLDLSKKLQRSRSSVGAIERGINDLSAHEFVAWAIALNTTTEFLYQLAATLDD